MSNPFRCSTIFECYWNRIHNTRMLWLWLQLIHPIVFWMILWSRWIVDYYSFLSDTTSASVAYSVFNDAYWRLVENWLLYYHDLRLFCERKKIWTKFTYWYIFFWVIDVCGLLDDRVSVYRCIVDLNKFRNLFPKSYYSKIIFKLLLGMPFYGYSPVKLLYP